MNRKGRVVKMQQEKLWDVHPVWRGIGLIMIVIIPIMSYTIGGMLIESYPAIAALFPAELTNPVTIGTLGPISYFWGKLVVTLLLTIAIYSVIFIVYSLIYGAAAGDMRYGPTDVTAKEYRESMKEMKQRAKKKKK